MFVAEILAAPRRLRLWRKAGRRWRRVFLLPPPEPGTEAAEWLAHFRRIRPRPIRRNHGRPLPDRRVA